jgi:DNA-binding transcriptional ArsR family regulator
MFAGVVHWGSMARPAKSFDKELFFRALADRTRLRLINLMGDDEVCACFFVEVIGTNQPKISRHLAYLRRTGVVTARREGKWMHYRTVRPSDPFAARILDETRRAATGRDRRHGISSQSLRATFPWLLHAGRQCAGRDACHRACASRGLPYGILRRG